MKLLKSVIPLLTASIMLGGVESKVYAEFSNLPNVDECSKISGRLLEEFGIQDNDLQTMSSSVSSLRNEKIPVLIWCTEDIDYDVVESQTIASVKDKNTACASNEKNIDSRVNEKFTVNDILTGEVQLSDDEIQEFIETERATAKEMYQELNGQFVEKYLSDENVVYVSEYSPIVIAELNYEDVVGLAKLDVTSQFDYYSDSDEAQMNISTNAIRAVAAKSTYGYTGVGVKIGQYEAAVPNVENVQLSPISSNIHINPSCINDVNDHATRVADILVGQSVSTFTTPGIATGAELYCASDAMGRFAAMEWLIGQGVNVINISSTFGTDDDSTYGNYAKWLDHIALNHHVNIVQAAGNDGNNHYVISGAMAYNVVTVGSLDDMNTLTLNDDELASYSSYSRNIFYACKPDLCAPGTSIETSGGTSSGTSYAAPHVSGTIALMCQSSPILKLNASAVKSKLVTSVSITSPYRFCTTSWTSIPTVPCYTQYGAGMLDTYRAMQMSLPTSANSYFSYFEPGMSQRTYNMPVTSTNSAIRVGLAYNKDNSITGSHTSGSIDEEHYLPDLKLEVISPSGETVATCYKTCTNVQIVEFTPTQVGTYVIKVSADSAVTYGLEYVTVSWKELS